VTAANEHIEAANNFLLPNATFFAELLAFLVILAVLWKWVVPPVSKVMRERQDVIRKQLDDADEAKAKLAEAQAEYQRALNEARTQASVIRDNARAEAQRISDELRAQAAEESQRIIARGEEQLANQRRSIVRELRGEVGKLAVDLAGKIVGDSLADEARQRATVERFLADIDSTGDKVSS
jgi:F-type H+-transporting ATPase subunit b